MSRPSRARELKQVIGARLDILGVSRPSRARELKPACNGGKVSKPYVASFPGA